jgi:septum formation protein
MVKQRYKVMLHEILNDHEVILASQSPRRRELFSLLGISYRTMPANIPEPITGEAPDTQAMQYARQKAEIIVNQGYSASLVVAADTVVDIDNIVLGKPTDTTQAYEYLKKLSGREHYVHTGICVGYQCRYWQVSECTKVQFSTLTDADILAYIATSEPLDKAGAYGIQGYGAQFVSSIVGCYFNVMGFPVSKFYSLIIQLKRDKLL